MEIGTVDILDKVRTMVGATGSVKSHSGGLEIQVHDGVEFPWDAVFKVVLGIGQDVWLKQRKGVTVVYSKPPSI